MSENASYTCVDDERSWDLFIGRVLRPLHGLVGLDTETNGLGWEDHVVGISVAVSPGEAYYFPLRHSPPESLFFDGESVNFTVHEDELLRLLERVPSVCHNFLFDAEKLLKMGCRANIVHDSMIECYLTDCTEPKGLKEVSKRLLRMEMRKFEDLFRKGRGERRFDALNPQDEERDALVNYACQDADACLQVHLLLGEGVQKDCGDLYAIEMNVGRAVLDMRQRGILLDRERLQSAIPALQDKIAVLEREVIQKARAQAQKQELDLPDEVFEININAPEQVATLLFDHLKLPSLGNRSTKEEYIKPLIDQFECISSLLDHREAHKLLHSFVGTLPGLVCDDGAIRTQLKPYHTRTGRLSAEQPNLQQLPKFDEAGVRKAFVARPGYYLLDADFSQIEVRVFVALAGDPDMLRALESGVDFHQLTAQKLFRLKSIEEVTKKQRQVGKTINFGLLYGISEFGLSKQLGIEVDEAKRQIRDYFRAMPTVKQFIDRSHRDAKRDKGIRTHFGRRRPLPDVDSEDYGIQQKALRQATNSLVQGAAADLMKMALVRLHERLGEIGAYLLLTVHDQVLVEVPESVPFHVAEQLVRECMEIEVPGWCRLPVEATAGYRWGEEDAELMARGRPVVLEEPAVEPEPVAEDGTALMPVEATKTPVVPPVPPTPPKDTRMRYPAVVWHVPALDRELAAMLRSIRDACAPRKNEEHALYLRTKIDGRDLLVEARKPIAAGMLMWHFLKRLKLVGGMVCRVLDGEGQEIERQTF